MTKRKSDGESADQVEAYYRIWFEYLKEAEEYLAYCDLMARGEEPSYTLPKERTNEDARKELGFMHVYSLLGDPRHQQFEVVWKNIKNYLEPVVAAEREMYDSIVSSIEQTRLFSGNYPTVEELLYHKRLNDQIGKGPEKPELLEIIEEAGKLNGQFYIRVFPGVADLKTINKKLVRLIDEKMKDLDSMPYWNKEWASTLYPPRKSKIRISEWDIYLKTYRLREYEKLSFGKIAKILKENGNTIQIEDEKKVNEWHKNAVKIIDRLNKGLPIISPNK